MPSGTRTRAGYLMSPNHGLSLQCDSPYLIPGSPLYWVQPALLGCASSFIFLFIRSVTECVCATVENRACNAVDITIIVI